MSTITKKFYVDDVLTAPTSIVLSDPTGAFGVKRNDTDAVVVADGTAMTLVDTGHYTYTFADPAGDLTYSYWVEIVYGGETYRFEGTLAGASAAGSLWASTAEADAYFLTRFGISDYWTGTDKTAALTTAQAQLEGCGYFTFPTTTTDTMKNMLYEQVFMLLTVDPDIRLALQAQGVIRANVVGETYQDREQPNVAIAPLAWTLGEQAGYLGRQAAFIRSLSRTERTDTIDQ